MDDQDSLHSTDNSSSESDMDDQDSLYSTDSSSESDIMEVQPQLFAASPIFKAIFDENIEDIKDCLRRVDAGSGHIGSLFGSPFNINDALYWACYYGRVLPVKCLLAEGADPEKKPISSASGYPIHGACYGGGVQVLDALMFKVILNRGGLPYSRDSVSPFLDARDRSDSTALHLATRFENEQVVRYLLETGANPCLEDIAGKFPIEYTKAGTPIFERLWGFMNMFKSYKKEDQKKDKLHKSPGGMEDGPAAGSQSTHPPVAKK